MATKDVKVSNLNELDFFIKGFSEEISENLNSGRDLVILFKGAMGVGKTTFIKSLAKALKVKETVTSPSFTGIHEYSFDLDDGTVVFYHLDLYQVNLNLDAFFELMNREERLLFIIEWSEKLSEEVLEMFNQKKDYISILDLSIDKLSGDQRYISYGYRNT